MHVEDIHKKLITTILKCRQSRDLPQARRLHDHIRQQHLESHHVVGNYLVPLLVDCGSLCDARHVFDLLLPCHRTEFSWTSLITAYANHGVYKLALDFYDDMLHHGVASPTNRTYLSLLHACTKLSDAESGQLLHSETVKRGLDFEANLGNSLIHLYSNCGLLHDANCVLNALSYRSVVSWTALITGYAEFGLSEGVLWCFKQMLLESIPADRVTFLCSLKACKTVESLKTGQEIHSEATKRGWEREPYLGCALMLMYTKCGSVAESCCCFGCLQAQDVVSWNALLTAYSEQGLEEEAIECYRQMQLHGVSADSYTFACGLKSCGDQRAVEEGQLMHIEIIKKGLEKEVHVGSTLVDMYSKCGLVADADYVFHRLLTRNECTCTAMMGGYTEHGFAEEALACFKQMKQEGLSADAGVLIFSLKACSALSALDVGQHIHDEIIKRGLVSEVHVGSSLIDMYAKCGYIMDSCQVFDSLAVRNVVTWTALIGACKGNFEEGFCEEMLKRFTSVLLEGVTSDVGAFAYCLKICGTIGAVEIGRKMHAEVRKTGPQEYLWHMLIDMYGKCGLLSEAQEVFEKLSAPDVRSWTSMINAYGGNCEAKLAIKCFEEMKKQGVKPDNVTFLCVFTACNHANMVVEGQKYWKEMMEVHGIEPTLAHCACMVDLLSRSGFMHEAEKIIAAMQCSPSIVLLMSLLSACKTYGEVELAERCFQQLVEMRQEASAYVLLADIYTNFGMDSDASRIEEMRNCVKAIKKPGYALIEVNENVHEFVVGLHQGKGISVFLGTMNLRLRCEDYVPL